MSEYIEFKEFKEASRKTSIYHIISKSNGAILGYIKFSCAWRQFCFYPEYDTVFNWKCLTYIIEFITYLMRMREEK